MMAERKAEYERTRAAKRKAEHDALVERAKTDPEAARQLAEQRKYQSEAAVKSYQKMKAADPVRWVQTMNSIRSRAEEIIQAEMIYV